MKSLGPDFQEYEAVLHKVAAFSDPLWRKFESEIACRPGCAQCCTAGLTLLPIEAAFVLEALRSGAAVAPEGPEVQEGATAHCVCLTAQGMCGIYAFRPLLCRTHGLPLRLPDGDLAKAPRSLRVLDEDTYTCSLNFESGRSPPPGDVLDAEKLYQLLWVVNARFCARRGIEDPNRRVGLESLLQAHQASLPSGGG